MSATEQFLQNAQAKIQLETPGGETLYIEAGVKLSRSQRRL